MAENALIHKIIDRDRNNYRSGNRQPEDLQLFRSYADGERLLELTEEQKKILKGITENDFCDNVCQEILSSASDRCIFEGWTCQDKTVEQELEELFVSALVADLQGDVHYDTLLDGNHVVALGFNQESNRVELFSERWWDGVEGAFIAYDTIGRERYAVKDWFDDDDSSVEQIDKIIKRRNIFFPDHMERWISQDGGQSWEHLDISDEQPFIVDWRKSNGAPLRLPYIHFRNGGKGNRRYSPSDLDGGVTGFADQINDLQWAMSGAGRLTAFQIYTIAGMVVKKDPETGQIVPGEGPEVGAGQVWVSSSKDTKFGTLGSGDMSQLINLYREKLKALARMTRTPLHVITGGDWPSGEALIRAEQPAVGKAQKNINKWKDAWVRTAHRAVEIHNRFSTDGPRLPEEISGAVIRSRFASPERQDRLTKSVMLTNLKDILSVEQALREAGYTEEQVQKIMAERRAEKEFDAEMAAKSQPPEPVGSPAQGRTVPEPGNREGGANNPPRPSGNAASS